MCDQEISILKQSPGTDPKVKRNSGLFSFLRWFKSNSRESVSSDAQNSSSGTSGSTDSLNSTGTAASFSFIAPTVYVKNKGDNKCILQGPETDTYKARLKQRDKVRERDKDITLRKKYNLFFHRDSPAKNKREEEDNSKSLPLMTRKMEDERGHRRTNSESSKTKRAGAYLHVKGKRRAPQPPKNHVQDNTLSLRRKKRLAPQPPLVITDKRINTALEVRNEIIFNDSLRLDHGILKSAKAVENPNHNQNMANNSPNTSSRSSVIEAPVSPRPWYKRNAPAKKDSRYEPVEKLPEIKINKELKIDKKEDKRKSGMMFLTNISELDREASELMKREQNVLTEMPEFMRPKDDPNTTDTDTLTPKRRSAKDLIAKFNAITNVTKVTVNSALFGNRENPVFQREKRDYFGKNLNNNNNKRSSFAPLMKSETSACIIKQKKTWSCKKCNLENETWRLICHGCHVTIKPYSDDSNPLPKKNPENNEAKEVKRTADDGSTKNTALVGEPNNPLERSKTQIGFSALANYKKEDTKKDEREKLKKMLIEMKNSLPKRKSNVVLNRQRKSTIDENPELSTNLNMEDSKLKEMDQHMVKKEEDIKQIKPAKVSSSAQTSSVVKKLAPSKDFQLMRPKDFEDIYSEKSGKPNATHLYANLAQSENLFLNVPKRFSDIKNTIGVGANANTDTLEINRLLRRLENAIAKGDLSDAAIYARELAQLKVNCSVVRQKAAETSGDIKNGFMVEMYVEDRLSHRGPFPIQVTELQTVAELKQQVEREFEIPRDVQRWILGKELASNDGATLKDHNVVKDGCPVFLYLVAPSSNSGKDAILQTKEENIQDKKEINVPSTSKTEDPVLPAEKKEINTPSTPRIVEEKFKAIEKITDTKSKRILKIQEIPQKESPKIIAEQLKKEEQNEDLKKVDINEPTASSSFVKSILKELEVKEPPIALEEDFSEYDKTLKAPKTWECQFCTLLNPLTTNICLVCASVRQKAMGTAKRQKKQAPVAPDAKTEHYLALMNLDNSDLVSSVETFECVVCFVEIPAGEGVTLRECLHQFCRECLAHTIQFCEEAEVKCPFRDEEYSCDIALQDREVKALVTPLVYEQFLARSVAQAENKIDKSFHCKSPDCKGWCIFEDNVNEFRCPVCRKTNCLTCQAIHDGMNCKQYQERMNVQSETDEDAKRTREMLEEMVNKGEALTCPACQVILMKKWGCDWVRCSMCKTEICWVTKGLRWGPGGKGDTSGGCKCGVNGVKCHPQCNYCH